MSKLRNIVVATSAAVIAVSVASLALANFPAAGGLSGTEDFELEADAVAIPAPVTGVDLFVSSSAAGDVAQCMTLDKVVSSLKGEQAVIGGNVVMLEDGLQQDFADEWRRETGVGRSEVSAVVAHLFEDGQGGGIADVVEFAQDGCAMSRTLLSGQDWTALLRAAAGTSADA